MTELRLSEHNPNPDIHSDGFVQTPDGFSIRYAVFRTTKHPVKGTVIVLQGRNESIEKYFETIGDLVAAGFDVTAFDWRGQGRSTRFFSRGDAGYIDSFDQYATDLETIFTQVALPDCRPPHFILAHSTGALVALYAAPIMVNRIQRMVLMAPFLGLPASQLQNWTMRAVTKSLSFLGLGNMHVAGGSARRMRKPFEANQVTSDAHRYARNISIPIRYPELALGGPSAAWTAAVFDAIDRIDDPAHLAQTVIPTLVMMAGDEGIVSNDAIRLLTIYLRSASLLTIDGARHEILQEADIYREQFMAAFLAFVPGSGPTLFERFSD
ncbi:alpha/beta fold hydrolase [Oricola indica]|uniref:alpha/beta fold hydrolase n=1 Tax=Oricola indica TaxID=2872591 RepID=UPI003CCBCF15